MSTTWRDRRSISRGLAALVSIVLLSLIGPIVVSGAASAQDPAAVRAAKEIQAARDRANAAAQAMFDAESKLDTLDVEVVEAEKQLAAVEAQAASMRSSLQADAQRSFANSGTSIPLLVDLDQANAGITAERQASVARGAASVELDDFDIAMKQVNEQRAELERQKEATVQAREQFESLKTDRRGRSRRARRDREATPQRRGRATRARTPAQDPSRPGGCGRRRSSGQPGSSAVERRTGHVLELVRFVRRCRCRSAAGGSSSCSCSGTGAREPAAIERRQRHRLPGRRTTGVR